MTKKKHDQPLSQPDPETEHTTDPQEHMKGPVSSVMQDIKEKAEETDIKTQGDARGDDNRNDRS